MKINNVRKEHISFYLQYIPTVEVVEDAGYWCWLCCVEVCCPGWSPPAPPMVLATPWTGWDPPCRGSPGWTTRYLPQSRTQTSPAPASSWAATTQTRPSSARRTTSVWPTLQRTTASTRSLSSAPMARSSTSRSSYAIGGKNFYAFIDILQIYSFPLNIQVTEKAN